MGDLELIDIRTRDVSVHLADLVALERLSKVETLTLQYPIDSLRGVEGMTGVLRPGAMLNGRYVIDRVPGQGGFGITYLAFDTQLDARVTIKEFMPGEIATRTDGATVSVMSADRPEDFGYSADRFLEEARILVKFSGTPQHRRYIQLFSGERHLLLRQGGQHRRQEQEPGRHFEGGLHSQGAVHPPGRQGPYTDVYSCAACFYAALTGYLPPESLDRLEDDPLVPVSRAGWRSPTIWTRPF